MPDVEPIDADARPVNDAPSAGSKTSKAAKKRLIKKHTHSGTNLITRGSTDSPTHATPDSAKTDPPEAEALIPSNAALVPPPPASPAACPLAATTTRAEIRRKLALTLQRQVDDCQRAAAERAARIADLQRQTRYAQAKPSREDAVLRDLQAKSNGTNSTQSNQAFSTQPAKSTQPNPPNAACLAEHIKILESVPNLSPSVAKELESLRCQFVTTQFPPLPTTTNTTHPPVPRPLL